VRWRWASGEEILNDSVLPLCAQGVLRLVLFGTRSSVDASTWESYEDKVNSDTFLGRTAGKCIFKGASFSPRVLEDGTETNDIELHIETRNRSWNQFYNETTGEWEEIRRQDGGGNWTVTAFSAVAFSDLLEVPS
ncbi:MAG TPA: hypothetical protein VMW52_03580, partial [Phycisphaerae bacterium]|nr:hypothetical protein [Phycisphaerae bacterium]